MSEDRPRIPSAEEQAYLRTVSELQALASRCPYVSHDWVLAVASMDVADMRRRLIRSNDWHGHFSHSLDGIPQIQNMPGAAPDGCWSHKEVRGVVLGLVRKIERLERASARVPVSPVPPAEESADSAGESDLAVEYRSDGVAVLRITPEHMTAAAALLAVPRKSRSTILRAIETVEAASAAVALEPIKPSGLR